MAVIRIEKDALAEIEAAEELFKESIRTESLRVEPEPSDFNELAEAYSDVNHYGGRRQLKYWSSALFPLAAYKEAMGDACTRYNDFNLNRVCDIIERAIASPYAIQPAREGSVALYIHSIDGAPLIIDPLIMELSRADEIELDKCGLVLRLWFD